MTVIITSIPPLVFLSYDYKFDIVIIIRYNFADSTALSCAKLMWEMGSKNPVKIIKGISCWNICFVIIITRCLTIVLEHDNHRLIFIIKWSSGHCKHIRSVS